MATSVYLMVDDAAVSLEDRGVRLCRPDGGFSGPPQLFILPDARLVRVPGSAVEAAVVHEEQAGAQEKHEKHGYPMALTQRHKQMLTNERCCAGLTIISSILTFSNSTRVWPNFVKTACTNAQVRSGARLLRNLQ